jgi:hypothetical protein
MRKIQNDSTIDIEKTHGIGEAQGQKHLGPKTKER